MLHNISSRCDYLNAVDDIVRIQSFDVVGVLVSALKPSSTSSDAFATEMSLDR